MGFDQPPVPVPRPLLAITIPTFERPDFVRHQILALGPLLARHGVPLYISDNGQGPETRLVVEELAGVCDLHYSQNETNLGDVNFMKAIGLPDAEYRWLLSDSTLFSEKGLVEILAVCQRREFDCILLNSGRVGSAVDREYLDCSDVLRDLGWHLTLISCFIYSEKVVAQVDLLGRYRGSNFLHHALLFEFLANETWRVYWKGRFVMKTVPLAKPNTWTSQTYEIWTRRWTEYVLSLPPAYTLPAKLWCIKAHGLGSSLFGLRRIAEHRATGVLDRKIWKKYERYFAFTVRHGLWLAAMAHAPRFLARATSQILGRGEKAVERLKRLFV